MKRQIQTIFAAVLSLTLLGSFFVGCESESDDIPTSWESIESLMADGWAAYAANDFQSAYDSFLKANKRNAFYLPAYNGLGWCAVRMTDFSDAENQFSFIITLADPQAQAELLADTYAGRCLNATVERFYEEIYGDKSGSELEEYARSAIGFAQVVFDLLGENYAPVDHDPGFGSAGLHLLNAQNYYYLQEFWNAESELSYVDVNFVDSLSTALGSTVEGETIQLTQQTLEIGGTDTLVWTLTPQMPAVHNTLQVTPPDTSWHAAYQTLFGLDVIWVQPDEGTELEEGAEFTVDYLYIESLDQYLYELAERIESLIEI